VRRRGREKEDRLCPENGTPPDWKLLLNDRIVWLLAWADWAGWLNCNGAGLLAWANSTQPARKLNSEATVIHSRILFLMIFIISAFRYLNMWVDV
jgi:hypothetical protein